MRRIVLKLIPLFVLACVLVVASWEPENFGLSYGASAPLPQRVWLDYLLVKQPPTPAAPSWFDSIFAASLPPVPGGLSSRDVASIFAALVLLLLWLEGWSRRPRSMNKTDTTRKVVSKHGSFYVRQGVAAHRARHKL